MRAGTRRAAGLLVATVVLSGAATATAAATVPPDDAPVGPWNVATQSNLTVPSMSLDDGAPALQRAFPYP